MTTSPEDAGALHRLDPELLDLVLGYVRERVSMPDVPLDQGVGAEPLRRALAGLLQETPRNPADVLSIYADHLATTVISCDSPRFLAFIPAAPTKAVAALRHGRLRAVASRHLAGWRRRARLPPRTRPCAASPTSPGFPRRAGGVFVSGGSAANLSALAVARERPDALGGTRPRAPLRGWPSATRPTHRSATRCTCWGWTRSPVADRRPPADRRGAAGGAGRRPGDAASVVAVVATAGTTNAGIIDDLAGVGDVAHGGLWFHVDGAYGGAGLLAPSIRPTFAGIERADSFVVDPHKWLFAPFDWPHCSTATRAGEGRTHPGRAYLDVIHADDGEWNPTDYAYHLTRRARGLPLWFSLAVNGTAAYRSAVEAAPHQAAATAELIKREPQLELIREPELSVLLFRRQGWGPDDYDAWSQRLLTPRRRS